MDQATYDVVVAGAGPVGLALAIELGLRSVRCLVVERNDRVGYSPRAKTTNVRTREHLRRFGTADTLREASPIPPDYPFDVVFATRMTGPPLARFTNVSNGGFERSELYSENGQWVPQYTLEDVLRNRACAMPGIDVRFETELAASLLEVPLTVTDPNDERLRRLYRARFVLVRPDQHVAWRADRLPQDPAGVLAHVAGHPGAKKA